MIGVPASLGFLVATLVVYLLQRFPLTGIFLMILAAPFWSAVLFNLGMARIMMEVPSGKVGLVWLALPTVYLGTYYSLYAQERRTGGALIVETGAHDPAQLLPFDAGSKDLQVFDGADGGLHAAFLLRRYPLDRVFDGNGRVVMLADAEARALVAGNKVFASANIQASALRDRNDAGAGEGIAQITMPGRSDRPVVEVRATLRDEKQGSSPVRLVETQIIDTEARRIAVVRSGRTGPLRWRSGAGITRHPASVSRWRTCWTCSRARRISRLSRPSPAAAR